MRLQYVLSWLGVVNVTDFMQVPHFSNAGGLAGTTGVVFVLMLCVLLFDELFDYCLRGAGNCADNCWETVNKSLNDVTNVSKLPLGGSLDSSANIWLAVVCRFDRLIDVDS